MSPWSAVQCCAAVGKVARAAPDLAEKPQTLAFELIAHLAYVPENRVALRQTLRAVNQKNQPIIRQARQERRSALQALSTPGADPAEVARRLATARALEQEARTNVESAFAAFAATLSPAERAALAEGLQQIYAAQGREQGGREQGGARPGRQ